MFLLVSAVLIVSGIALSYSLLTAVIGGMGVGMLVAFLSQRGILRKALKIGLYAAAVVALVVGVSITVLVMGNFSGLPYTPGCMASDYEVELIPQDPALSVFRASEQIALGTDRLRWAAELSEALGTPTPSQSEESAKFLAQFNLPDTWKPIPEKEYAFRLPDRLLMSRPRGLLVLELIVTSPSAELRKAIIPVGFRNYSVCVTGERTVTIDSLPSKSFLSAKNAFDVKVATYLDVESVQWITMDSTIAFAMIRPPYQQLRPLVDTVIHLTYTRS